MQKTLEFQRIADSDRLPKPFDFGKPEKTSALYSMILQSQ